MLTDVPLLPEQASAYAGQVDALFVFLLAITLFFTGLITVLIATLAVKYRGRWTDERPPEVGASRKLEVAWSLIRLVISRITFYWGAHLFFHASRPPDDAMEMCMVAQQWMWKAQHREGQREINELHVPVDRAVKVTLTSQDVIHS